MPRRIQHPALPPNQRPRTRANVADNHLALVAPLPLRRSRRRLRPGQAAAPLNQPLRTPSISENWEVTTIVSSLDDPVHDIAAAPPAHVRYTFRGRAMWFPREQWEDPDFQQQLREQENVMRARERRERLRRARVGTRGRGARRAAWKRGGERVRDLRGRLMSHNQWDVGRWVQGVDESGLALGFR